MGGEGSEKLDVHRKAHECCVPRAGQVRQVRARRAPLESFAEHARVRARRPWARFWAEVTGPRSRGLGSRDRRAWALTWAPKILWINALAFSNRIFSTPGLLYLTEQGGRGEVRGGGEDEGRFPVTYSVEYFDVSRTVYGTAV